MNTFDEIRIWFSYRNFTKLILNYSFYFSYPNFRSIFVLTKTQSQKLRPLLKIHYGYKDQQAQEIRISHNLHKSFPPTLVTAKTSTMSRSTFFYLSKHSQTNHD